MYTLFSEERSADAVIDRLDQCKDPRFAQVMEAAIRHLHAFVREVEPTMEEWAAAIRFLTETGQMCDDTRQEWILASDTLGVSMLVETLNNRAADGSTEATVLGPFHVADAPMLEMGASIRRDGAGEPCAVSGRVVDTTGAPVSGAVLDVWQTNGAGYYDVQQPGEQPAMNMRGRFITGDDGAYAFETAKPVPYPIPTDGPVGKMLARMGRHPYRPAHIHFIVQAAGFRPVTTHIFVDGDPYLDSDAVFGVKESLIVPFEETPGGWRAAFDIVLAADA
jgi:protocatechuate 3,4-dioxygenase beta subunit